jgi:hypothetical protein
MRDWGRLCAGVALERVWLHLKEGRIKEAVAAHERLERLAERYNPSVDFAWSEILRYSALAGAYLASTQRRFRTSMRGGGNDLGGRDRKARWRVVSDNPDKLRRAPNHLTRSTVMKSPQEIALDQIAAAHG